MRTIQSREITNAVKRLSMETNYYLGEDVLQAFRRAMEDEGESPTGKSILKALLKNADIAATEQVPICQDTGFAVVYVEVGQDARIEGDLLEDAVNEGVRQGYKEGYLRKSICDPFTRQNTKDNTPAVVITDIVPGDKIKIIMAPKGGGSENMSRVTMLKPSEGLKGIEDFVVQRANEAGSNPCPPVLVGVGIGGTSEKVAILARRALFRKIGSTNPDPELDASEKRILRRINNLGMGPQGLGGRCYAMAVHIEKFPCHIAQLPVAVNICCHASRHEEVTI